MPNIIVGTAGHIDHGKTALVKALTGVDADRLKEEKERGITIDLGFASLRLDDDTTLGFVDVPGHERFVKNMLAGVGGIDIVMLVIAADESVMPQTREHLDICSLLQVKRGLTALTKIDATDPELVDLAEIEVQEFLMGSFLDGAPLLRVSSRTGEGIPQLVATLAGLARAVPERDATRVMRLPIDRGFMMKGFGTVVSGTLIAGRVRRDEEVEILPQRRPARVRGIQVHGAAVAEARAGQRTALNLQRIELTDVERGMVVVPPGVFSPSQAFDVDLTLLPSAGAPIVRRKRIRFHVGTAELMGYAVLLGRDVLEPGQTAVAQILLERPTFALPGDRFIIRQYSPMTTIGGGEILDPYPARHRRSDLTVVARLERLRHPAIDSRLLEYVRGAEGGAITTAEIVSRLGIPEQQAHEALMSEARAGNVRVIGENPLVVSSTGAFARAADTILDEVRAFHTNEPLVTGIGREELKGRVRAVISAAWFDGVLDQLIADRQLALDQDLVHLFDRTVTLDEGQDRIRQMLADRFSTVGLEAPTVNDLLASLNVEPRTAKQIVQLMVKDNVLVKINEDTMIDPAALKKLVADVRALKSVNAKFGVREFKELTGLSRKFAVPLLEYLDGQRITRRVGDERIIL